MRVRILHGHKVLNSLGKKEGRIAERAKCGVAALMREYRYEAKDGIRYEKGTPWWGEVAFKMIYGISRLLLLS